MLGASNGAEVDSMLCEPDGASIGDSEGSCKMCTAVLFGGEASAHCLSAGTTAPADKRRQCAVECALGAHGCRTRASESVPAVALLCAGAHTTPSSLAQNGAPSSDITSASAPAVALACADGESEAVAHRSSPVLASMCIDVVGLPTMCSRMPTPSCQ